MVIESAVLETLKSPEGKTQDKVASSFAGAKKSAAQRDELRRRADICGADTDDWPGCHIVLYPSKTQMAGKTVDCIRVRPPAKSAKKAAAKSGGGLGNAEFENPAAGFGSEIQFDPE